LVSIANGLALTPPGQLGRAFGDAADAPAMALVHLALGSIWLPFLWAAFMSSAIRLSVSTRRSGGLDTADAERVGARLLQHHRWIAYVGLAVILYVAAEMIYRGLGELRPAIAAMAGL
jgi:hypothetical protein